MEAGVILGWCGSVKRQFQRFHRRGSILGAARISIKRVSSILLDGGPRD